MKRLLAVLLMLATGCATVQRGPMQRVTIESDPPGAEVELIGCGVDGLRTTPATVFIPRRVKRCSVLLLHDGFEPARVFLERRRAPSPGDVMIFEELCGDCDSLTDVLIAAAIGGILFGVSRGVDAAAGSNYELEPSHVQVALMPLR